MSLTKLQSKLEDLDGIELANTYEDDDWRGTVLHLTLEESYEGEGDNLIDVVLDTIPRDILPQNFDPDERIEIYYDAINIKI